MDSPTLPDSSTDGIVSVVIPVYNGAETIEACIASVLESDLPAGRFEVIVVDNGSTDETRTRLARYQDRIRILSEATRGPGAARNTGIRAARGRWVAFTDADCVVDRGWLRQLLPPLDTPMVGITGGTILATRPCNRIERFGEKIHDHRRAIEDFVPPYIITMNCAARRSVLVAAGLFDEGLPRGEDVDLAYRVQARGYRLAFCPDAVVFHRNEATLAGLFREGMDHGRGSVLVRAKGVHPVNPPRRSFVASRLLPNVRRLVLGMPAGRDVRFEALCAIVFDLGKAVGATATRRRLRRLAGGPRPLDTVPTGRAEPDG